MLKGRTHAEPTVGPAVAMCLHEGGSMELHPRPSTP
eukprot:CAMPEP_0174370142 /NCGR_PEP_ID=MMETSP0811_2-20130205/95107_1 /TAXON_ID=73025 ORGANISM="Eutreptiella gymnastica-like, Strain CCMP1594" /NCGR_SAMPLE_ID=MMETSP0811_2 /ASSEMBLY_ACC=CAM_ASM_000667 /LENGTH=35 /DNA_ID= /DNA_START= /DNA_END= /DNA_ORIENTATION=